MVDIEAKAIFHAGLEAWAEDLTHRSATPLPEIEIVPLVCLWKHVMTSQETNRSSAWEFSNDLLADELLVRTLGSRLLYGDSSFWKMPDVPVLAIARLTTVRGPDAFGTKALLQGRPEAATHVLPKEAAIAGLLGKAAYNSASGMPIMSLEPLGPASSNPEGWKILGFTQTEAFVESIV